MTEAELDERAPLPTADLSTPRQQRLGLLITEEDCLLETLELPGAPVAAMGLTATRNRSRLPVGRLAIEFAEGAARDGLRRLAEHFEIETTQPSSTDWGKTLSDWASHQRLEAIVTTYAPVGPVAERLSEAKRELATRGIGLIQLRRSYDTVAWPHAGRGFFGLKRKIPAVLTELGIGSRNLELETEHL